MNYLLKAIIEDCKKEYKLDLPMEIRLKEENDRLRQRQMLRDDEIKDLRIGLVYCYVRGRPNGFDNSINDSIVKG